MLTSSLAPYLLWAKTRQPAALDLAGSNLLHCTIDELAGARDSIDLSAPNDNGYGPLLESIARHYNVDTDRVATASGCSGANFLVVAALVAPGDHVLIEQPSYDPLVGICRLMGARVERFARRFEERWALDFDDLRRRLTPATRLIIVTSPHNPSGTTLDATAIRMLGALADHAGAHVLVDEVYLDSANLVAEATERVPPAATLGGSFISTSSLTKSYGLAGIKCGWIVASKAVAERAKRTRDLVDNAGSAPADRLGALAFTQLPRLAERATSLLGANIALARRFLAACPELEVSGPPRGSVIFPRLQGVADAEPFVQELLNAHGVAVAPGRFFDAPAHFRISLAGRPEALASGLERIQVALASSHQSR